MDYFEETCIARNIVFYLTGQASRDPQPSQHAQQLHYFQNTFHLSYHLNYLHAFTEFSLKEGYPRSGGALPASLVIDHLCNSWTTIEALHMIASQPINFITTRKITSQKHHQDKYKRFILTLRQLRRSQQQYDLVFSSYVLNILTFAQVKGNARMFEARWPFIHDAFTNMERFRWSSFSQVNSFFALWKGSRFSCVSSLGVFAL